MAELATPYGFAGCSCIGEVQRWTAANNLKLDDVTLLFEAGDTGKGNLEQLAKRAFGVTPLFWPKERSCVFQAADLLAYEQFKAHKSAILSEDKKVDWDELRYPVKELIHFRGGKQWKFADTSELLRRCVDVELPKRKQVGDKGDFDATRTSS